ncbi:MAG: c-type cytochrome [Dehalococcoidia bacterium]
MELLFILSILAGSALLAWGVGWGQPVALAGGVVLLILSVLGAALDWALRTLRVVLPVVALVVAGAFLATRGGEQGPTTAERETPVATTPAAAGAPRSPAPGGQDLVALGRQLASAKGCVACHTATGGRSTGPTWKGLFGKRETLEDGSQVTVDEAYIRESVLNPNAKVVRGFPAVMPQLPVTEQELEALIAYIKSLQ